MVKQATRPTLEMQADLVEDYRLETLLYCPNAWALRHLFINQATGETIRARCNRWDCLYCGPRKVDQWRQLVKAAEPTLFLTLSKAGKTVEEAARALTVFMRFLRRGSKGKGPNKLGARDSYPVEYFAVLERHRNFTEVGFHWHLLLRGVDFIPYKEVLQPAWMSATHGQAMIGHIETIRRPQAIGYVTKYLTKAVTAGEKGIRTKQHKRVTARLQAQEDSLHQVYEAVGKVQEGFEVAVYRYGAYSLQHDEQGQPLMETETTTIEDVSRARRIRYSRNFFPESVADLRARLFADLEQQAMKKADDGKPLEESATDESSLQAAPSSWCLIQQAEFTSDMKEYQRRRRSALLDVLTDMRVSQRHLSRRVINIWDYQRNQLRKEGIHE